MNMVRDLFPSNPFVGGLGNRENDAIAYLQAGVALENIFIIDTSSNVQQMNNPQPGLTYRKMTENIANFFPPFNAPKVGY